MTAKKLYIETYGCQMNVADSEVVASVMGDRGFTITEQYADADAILVNTCSVRDNAEKKIWNRLSFFKSLKKKNPKLVVGLIGCMAERIGEELIEKKNSRSGRRTRCLPGSSLPLRQGQSRPKCCEC